MAESPKVPRKTYRGEDIYQDLTSTSLDKMMKYHRLANAAIEPKLAVLSELKKVYDYADSFVGKFETISPRFVANMHRLVEIENNCMDIRRLLAKIGHREAEYLRSVLKKHVVSGKFKLGKDLKDQFLDVKKSIQNHCTPIRNFAARIWKENVAYASRNFTHTGRNSSSPTSNDL